MYKKFNRRAIRAQKEHDKRFGRTNILSCIAGNMYAMMEYIIDEKK